MKLLKRMAVLSLVVLALGGCTKSSISTDAPVSGSEEIDPAKTVNAHNHKIPALKFQRIRPVMFAAFLLVLLASDPAVQIVPSYHFLSH